MSAIVIRADARDLPLPDASVDLIVTSPPYYGLRSYTDDGEHYAGQIGSEATPASYVAALLDCTREWMRVLKPTGSLWVNLGDKYNAYNGNRGEGGIQTNGPRQTMPKGAGLDVKDLRPKSLLGLPWRYAIGAIDDLGLILRAELVWSKPNGLPESVTDRVRRSHETWFHFTKRPRYFSAVDAIRTPALRDDARASGKRYSSAIPGIGRKHQGLAEQPNNALGSLPGSVWEIATEPLSVPAYLGVDHFAAFPTEWPRRLILGWSPSGICIVCGGGRRPYTAPTGQVGRMPGGGGTYRVMKAVGAKDTNLANAALRYRHVAGEICACTPFTDHPGLGERDHTAARRGSGKTGWHSDNGEPMPRISGRREYHLDSWAPPAARPAVVLDPFGGTGTTALVAHALGRTGISVDRSADYCRIANWRTTDPAQLAKAMRVDAPPVQLRGQQDLLSLLDGAA